MKIPVPESSGNKNDSSNMPAKEFIRGAQEAGNEVTEFDVFRVDIRPYRLCNHHDLIGNRRDDDPAFFVFYIQPVSDIEA